MLIALRPLRRTRAPVVTGSWHCPTCRTEVTIQAPAGRDDDNAAAVSIARQLDDVRSVHRCP